MALYTEVTPCSICGEPVGSDANSIIGFNVHCHQRPREGRLRTAQGPCDIAPAQPARRGHPSMTDWTHSREHLCAQLGVAPWRWARLGRSYLGTVAGDRSSDRRDVAEKWATNKGIRRFWKELARPAGLEPATLGLEGPMSGGIGGSYHSGYFLASVCGRGGPEPRQISRISARFGRWPVTTTGHCHFNWSCPTRC